MDNNSKKSKKRVQRANPLEAIKDIGNSTLKSLETDVFKETPRNIKRQLFGFPPRQRFSGEIAPGEQLAVDEVLSGEVEEKKKIEKQLFLERRLRKEEKIKIEQETNQLKLHLHAIMEEITTLAKVTPELAQEVKIATLQTPANPGIYHLLFFEKILEFIISFRKRIEDAAIWLSATNKRAKKKNYWATYKKQGAKFLLAPDHYLTRSSG